MQTLIRNASLVVLLTGWLQGCVTDPDPPDTDTDTDTDTGATEAFQVALEWHTGHGTAREEHVHEGLQTLDGGYIAIGHVAEGEDLEGPSDMLIVKVRPNGTLHWQTIVGIPGYSDVGITIAETDDGYIAGGGLTMTGRQQRALVKLRRDGEVDWQLIYAHAGFGAIRGIEVLDTGEIIATGYLKSEEPGFVFIAEAEAFLLKTNPEGNLIWDQSLDLPQGTKVQATDNGYTILSTGWMEVGGEDVQQITLTHTDTEGHTTQTDTYGDGHNVQAFDFDRTEDGGFVLAGHTTGYDAANWDCLMMRVAPTGELAWAHTYGQPREYDAAYIHDECYGVRQTPDGGFLMVGGTGDEYAYSASGHPTGPSDEWKAYAIHTDPEGAVNWQGIYGDGSNEGHNAAEYLALTADGGALLFTDTDSAGEPEPNNFGFMKLAPLP